MASLLSKLRKSSKSALIVPRDIFMSLPRKKYDYPRDVQTEVWKKWFVVRDNKNNIIKMNTGSGKTVVGLIILQSCLNEGKGPAVYVAPDNYLVAQVLKAAGELGINATDNKDNYQYGEGKAILVTNIYSLVNGRSVFGMRQSNNYPIGSVVIDDVHACLDTITSQYTIKIPSNHSLYEELIKLLSDGWKSYNYNTYHDVAVNGDPNQDVLIPFWIWQEKQDEIYDLLSKYNNNDEKNKFIYFNLPLIKDVLATCDCIVSSKDIEIVPEGISISKIESFENAQRRIFMSATLSDDSVFVSSVGLFEEDIKSIITPDNAKDIGDRLILFPKYLNSDITNDQIREKVLTISRTHNVVVIVPSYERSKYWDKTGNSVITGDNIEEKVTKLQSEHVGLVILVNRYDGVDLPDDACRLLVIDGLPPLKNKKDSYIQSIDPNSTILKREQIQRIEQGMGRGVRSYRDYCCVVLMGDQLATVLTRNNGAEFFSNATKAQYDLSKRLWGLLKEENPNPTVDDIFELIEYSFGREEEWVQSSQECLSDIHYDSNLVLDNNVVALRKAFDYSVLMQSRQTIDSIDDAIRTEPQDKTKGVLLQVKAKYTNLSDKSKAQEILLSGKKYNKAILTPIIGTQYNKEIKNLEQAKKICEYINHENLSQNEFKFYIESILSKLIFSEDKKTVNPFEEAMMKLGKVLGFDSSRPEKETDGAGNDVLWGVENGTYLIIECKSAATNDYISKDNCNQLGGSMRWFENKYKSKRGVPVIVHKSHILDSRASAVDSMKVINELKLNELLKVVRNFAVAISQNENWLDVARIDMLLKQYQLCGKDIIKQYMVDYKTK